MRKTATVFVLVAQSEFTHVGWPRGTGSQVSHRKSPCGRGCLLSRRDSMVLQSVEAAGPSTAPSPEVSSLGARLGGHSAQTLPAAELRQFHPVGSWAGPSFARLMNN